MKPTSNIAHNAMMVQPRPLPKISLRLLWAILTQLPINTIGGQGALTRVFKLDTGKYAIVTIDTYLAQGFDSCSQHALWSPASLTMDAFDDKTVLDQRLPMILPWFLAFPITPVPMPRAITLWFTELLGMHSAAQLVM
jgi:hypothetical protein